MDVKITLAALLLRRNFSLFEEGGTKIKTRLFHISTQAKRRTLLLKEAEEVIKLVNQLKAGK